MQGYTSQGYEELLRECGFDRVELHPSMGESPDVYGSDFFVITARKTAASHGA